jgi:hypothetical protein
MTTTMRSCSEMKSANIRKSMVLPLPVSPLMSNVFSLRICSDPQAGASACPERLGHRLCNADW